MPGILAGAVFAFVHSWDELVVHLFITSRKLYLLPRAIWAGINENVDPTIAAVATVLILATLGGLLLERYLSRRAARGGRLATLVARDTRAESAQTVFGEVTGGARRKIRCDSVRQCLREQGLGRRDRDAYARPRRDVAGLGLLHSLTDGGQTQA